MEKKEVKRSNLVEKEAYVEPQLKKVQKLKDVTEGVEPVTTGVQLK